MCMTPRFIFISSTNRMFLSIFMVASFFHSLTCVVLGQFLNIRTYESKISKSFSSVSEKASTVGCEVDFVVPLLNLSGQ